MALVCLSVCLSVCPSVCPLVSLSVCLSVCLSAVCLSVSVRLSVGLSVCLSVCLHFRMSVCLQVCKQACINVRTDVCMYLRQAGKLKPHKTPNSGTANPKPPTEVNPSTGGVALLLEVGTTSRDLATKLPLFRVRVSRFLVCKIIGFGSRLYYNYNKEAPNLYSNY